MVVLVANVANDEDRNEADGRPEKRIAIRPVRRMPVCLRSRGPYVPDARRAENGYAGGVAHGRQESTFSWKSRVSPSEEPSINGRKTADLIVKRLSHRAPSRCDRKQQGKK